MDRLRSFLAPRHTKRDIQEYEPLADGERRAGNGHGNFPADDDDDARSSFLEGSSSETVAGTDLDAAAPFSWAEYLIFAFLGTAMLWAWNMFLAASPYFQGRFASDPALLANFQSAILSVSTLTNLTAMLVLTSIQSSASYPFRINAALALNVCVFALLTASTACFLDASPGAYMAFLLLMVALASCAAGMMQNGAFAFAAGFGRPEYMQAIMAGQGVAGVLPPIAQMVSVLAFPPPPPPSPPGPDHLPLPLPPPPPPGGEESVTAKPGGAAFIYFLTAVLVSLAALVAFVPLVRRHDRLVEARMSEQMAASHASVEEAERASRRYVGMVTLFRRLRWVAASVFLCFAVTMFFPVFTGKILSVRTAPAPAAAGQPQQPLPPGPLFQPAAFIPLAFFFWNLGDLLGRVSTILPFSLRHRPPYLFAVALARLVFLPLYLLCNLGGRGAIVDSDLFYLLAIQLPFGLTNGWLGSSAMMAAGEWVADSEREAAGGFMGLCLVAGLSAGSLLSFTAAGI